MWQHGFALVRDWNLDVAALRMQAEEALRHAKPSGPVQRIVMPHLDALQPLLANASLGRLLRDYLGGPVRYDGHVLLRLTRRVTRANYNSANWHHDRCGRRLKVFVFLHDVDAACHCTVVAPGSHRQWYALHGTPATATSRFREQHIRRHYEPLPLTGRGGGGFVFDTNGLHKVQIGHNTTRTAVVLEFHAHGKLPRLHGDHPCPSLDPFRETVQGQRGIRAVPMYPPEP